MGDGVPCYGALEIVSLLLLLLLLWIIKGKFALSLYRLVLKRAAKHNEAGSLD